MITDITMNEMLEGLPSLDDNVHLLMFFGPTCGPCQATMPHYETAAEFYTEKNAQIKFYRINAWEPEEQAAFCREKMNVSGVPTFRAYYHSEQIFEKVGGGDEEAVKKFIHDIVDETFKRFGVKI